MKRILLFLTLFLMSFFIQAQSQYYFFAASNRACNVDNTISSFQYDNWDIYKTLNDEWNGTLDSTFCGQLNPSTRIDLNTVGTGETFFVRRHLDDNNKVLLTSNGLYSVDFSGYIDNINNLNLGNNCNGTFCTSLSIVIEIPDSAGTGTSMRWHEVAMTAEPSGYWSANICLPVEYFANNYLREIVFKFKVQDPNGNLQLGGSSTIHEVDSFNTTFIQDSIVVIPNALGEYNKTISSFANALVIKSNYNLYPSANGIEYIDIKPNPNIDTALTINLMATDPLVFQPFVELQGGYLLNDTTQRHHYNLVNNGGSLCIIIAERSFSNGNHYIHKAGHVDFGGKTSCMQFGESSKLIVGDNARLDYGFNGVGNLALRSRSSIEIGEGAELHINNNVMLFEYKYDSEPEQIYMTLNKGSKLSFGELAHIGNDYSMGGLMKLNIYMKGGEVDLSRLDPESRALVNLIYDTPTTTFHNNIKILGNPIQDNVRFSIVNEEAKPIAVHITSMNGQVVYNEIINTQKGYEEIQIPALGLANGLYFLTVQSNDEVFTEKIIILK